MTAPAEPTIVGPDQGEYVQLRGLGVRFLIDRLTTDGAFSLVEHPLEPRALGAPLHRHANEDEYSFILEGRMGAQLGDDVVEAGPGDLVFKPRNQWHTFWNAGDERCRLLEIISPAGFEQYFADVAEMAKSDPEMQGLPALAQSYGLEVDPASIPGLIERHGVRFG